MEQKQAHVSYVLDGMITLPIEEGQTVLTPAEAAHQLSLMSDQELMDGIERTDGAIDGDAIHVVSINNTEGTHSESIDTFVAGLINELNAVDVANVLPFTSLNYINRKLKEFGIPDMLGDKHID